MNHYKSAAGEVFAFESDEEMRQICEARGWTEMAPITDKEKEAILAPSLDDAAARKRREIESARDAAIDEGFSHTFGNADDIVQTRQRDRENLTGLAVSAQRHPGNLFLFRAKSNSTYELTADDMLALADAAQSHVSEQYGKSWELKARVDAALDAGDRDALERIAW